MAGFFLSGKAKIGANPTLGNSAEAIRAGYQRIRAGSHVVFFRKAGNEVEIVRILHKRMLSGRHLP
jgi:toxin ParE1/3/4